MAASTASASLITSAPPPAAPGSRSAASPARDPNAATFEPLALKIQASGADAVFLGGLVSANGGKLIQTLRRFAGPQLAFLASDGFTPFDAVVRSAGRAAEGMTISVPGAPPSRLPAAGKDFASRLQKAIGGQPRPYTLLAAQAAELLLQAIAQSDGSRASVVAHLVPAQVRGGLLGNFTIDKNGDISLRTFSIYRIAGGKAHLFTVISPA